MGRSLGLPPGGIAVDSRLGLQQTGTVSVGDEGHLEMATEGGYSRHGRVCPGWKRRYFGIVILASLCLDLCLDLNM